MTATPPEFNLQSYDFDLPEALIAQDPTDKRGESRLLVLERESGAVRDAMFADLPDLLPPGALLVVNNTKVLPARLIGRKESGGKVEFLLLTPLALITHQTGPDGLRIAIAEGLLKASKGRAKAIASFFMALSCASWKKANLAAPGSKCAGTATWPGIF